MTEAWAIDAGELLRRGARRNPRKLAVIWEDGERTYAAYLLDPDQLRVEIVSRR